MTNPLKMPCQIWTVRSQIWPDFAKSEICPKSEIWLFTLDFNDLMRRFQIWLGCLPNLNPNLDFANDFRDFCQISDLAKSPPKGVGDLPAKRGKFTTYPLGIVPGPKSWPDPPRKPQTGKVPPMAQLSLTPTPLIAPLPGAAVILALDLGTTTGWAVQAADGLITSGTVSFRPSRYDGGGMRYLRFRGWLDQLARDAGAIRAIHFEEVRRHVATDAAYVYGGLLATLTAWAETSCIAYQGVPVGTIKRHATGRGNADKTAMMAAARSRGFSPVDDNEADAIAILLWAIETNGGVA